MNDYQMSALTTDRSRQLHAEAAEARLARAAKPSAHAAQPSKSRSSSRFWS